MLKQFTSALCLAGVMVLGACSSVPLPATGEAQQHREPTAGVSAETGQSAGSPELDLVQVVPTPPLQPGNQALFDRAVALLREQQYESAEVLFQELTSSQPELAGPWVNLGHIYLAQDRAEEAQAAFAQALQANPKNCDAHNQMGLMARREGRFSDAEQHYLSCLEANPGYHHARLNLGILYELYMGRLGEALASYHDYQALLAQPDDRVNGWVMDLERRVASVAKR